MLLMDEHKAAALEELLRHLVDHNTFNAIVSLEIARRTGIDLHHGPDVINGRKQLKALIEVIFEDDES